MALLDLLSQDNHILINVNIARTFGLSTAVYWGELLNVLGKVKSKKTHDEQGFFKLDRKYIEKKTTLSLEEQLLCDHYLVEACIIQPAENDTDTIRVDVEAMINLIANGDPKELEKLAKLVKKNKKTKTESRRAGILNNLKVGIKEPEPLKSALDNWVDAIFAAKKQMTAASRDIFIKVIKGYSSDINVQLKVIEYATIQAYGVAEWAIKIYENAKAQGLINTQKKSTGLSDETF
ncbi:MAG: hypothetical protein J6A25_07800 [Lachnospiraceae bacterium]|nr:hypothetical protein [Lachnospiraceae bacterium]MBO5425402.1 hypothetical protein [Lachnospiraceae bacterium]